MKPIRVLIVDDEPPAREKIRLFLESDSRFKILDEAGDGEAAIAKIRELKPDLVFLDIQMPKQNGMEVIRTLKVANLPEIVFTTAYDQYALKAFDLHAVDYLLKPYDRARFDDALVQAVRRLDREEHHEPLEALLTSLQKPKPEYTDRLLLKSGKKMVLVNLADVYRISAEEKYVRIHTPAGTYLHRETMNRMEERLDPEKFVRVHRGEIIHIDAIESLEPWSRGDYIITLKDGNQLNLSRNYRDQLLERLGR